MALTERDTLKYRWEFTRRNHAYSWLYHRIEMLLKLSGKTVVDLKDDPEKLSESLKYDGDSMKELDQELVERFGFPFFIPLHPNKTFEEIEEYLLEVEPKLFVRRFQESVRSVSYDIADDLSLITIKVHVPKVNNLTSLIENIRRTISETQEEYDRLSSECIKMNGKDYDEILKIGDSYAKLKSIRAVSDEMYPGEERRNAENKVSQRLSTYNHLVNFGFRKLTTP